MALLTKSKYMNGLQCPRLLWYSNKKLLPKPSLSDEHKFAQGHEFEEYVKQLYPDSVDLNGLEFEDNLIKTAKAVEEGKIIFEAAFKVDDLFVRSDLMIPSDDGWELYEIKSSSKLKPQHIPDLAFQKYVLEKSGLKINKCFVIFINNEYIRNGAIDVKELVAQEEVTEKVELVKDIKDNVKKFLEIMNLSSYDNIPISQMCNKPYPCSLKEECWGTLPENNVLHLTNWRLYWKLFSEGIIAIKDVPEGTKLTAKDEIIIQSLKESPYISKEHIKHFLSTLKYPLYHFDFETYDTAIPLFDKLRPYQKVPFQYSLHIESKDGSLEHKGFLFDGSDDPRPAMLEQMKKDLEGTGTILVFNKSFEISVMNKLAEDFPEHSEWLLASINRVIDLADPFRAFYWYDKSQKGSYSIKKVLPAVTGKSYSELEIANGGDASMMYFYSHVKINSELSEGLNKSKVRANLLKYCGLDTEGMVWVLEELNKLIE